MQFRFKPEHFFTGRLHRDPTDQPIGAEQCADIANDILEAEEKKCERVYGSLLCNHDKSCGFMVWMTEESKPATHTALLWGKEKVEK